MSKYYSQDDLFNLFMRQAKRWAEKKDDRWELWHGWEAYDMLAWLLARDEEEDGNGEEKPCR